MGSRYWTFKQLTSPENLKQMAPTMHSGYVPEESMSRTDQYRKIVKPLIERKRRARINACLDELKDLMVYALQTEGESISKLEKADVLELTVKHLRKLKRQQMLALNPALDMDRFHAGYTTCATEVSRTLASTGVDISIGSRLMSHLGHKLNSIEATHLSPLTVRVPEPRHAKYMRLSSPSSDLGYESGRDSPPSPSSSSSPSSPCNTSSPLSSPHRQAEPVWRPF